VGVLKYFRQAPQPDKFVCCNTAKGVNRERIRFLTYTLLYVYAVQIMLSITVSVLSLHSVINEFTPMFKGQKIKTVQGPYDDDCFYYFQK